MIQQNPLRTNFQEHYEEIVNAYNREKDRATIEKTFEELLKLVDSLDHETKRMMSEGLDEETLALFDLLIKPNLSKKEIDRIKKVAKDLLVSLMTSGQRLPCRSLRSYPQRHRSSSLHITNTLWNWQKRISILRSCLNTLFSR